MDDYGFSFEDEDILTVDDIMAGTCYVVDFPVFEFVPPPKILAIEVSSAFAQSVANKVVGHCSVLTPVPCDDDRNFRLFRLCSDAQVRNFLNGHPLADLPLNVPLKLRNMYDDIYTAKALKIGIDDGTILFDVQVNSVHVLMHDYCVNKNDRFVSSVLSEYGSIIRKGGPDAKELDMFFDQSLSVLPAINRDDDAYRLIQGVAGSGKSRELVKDVIRRRSRFDLVIAPTNKSVLSLAQKFTKEGIVSVHYTNDFESEYDYKKIFHNSSVYRDYMSFKTRPRKTDEEKKKWKEVKAEMLCSLFDCVVLATPVMARSLISSFNLKSHCNLTIYVDEAGILKTIDVLPIMLARRRSLWCYGDYRQNRPFVSEEGLDFQQRVELKLNKLMTYGLLEWMADMDLPKHMLNECKRLPEKQAKPFVEFFYDDNSSDGRKYQQVFNQDILTHYKVADFSKMPKAIRDFPYLFDRDKERESCYLWAYLTALDLRYYSDDVVFICTHNYLVDSVKEILGILFKEKKYKVETSYLSQSETYQSCIFVPPSRPGFFVTDRLYLVSLSRHLISVKCPQVDTKTFFPKKFVWYSLMKGMCVGTWKIPKQRSKERGYVRYRNKIFVKIEWNVPMLTTCIRAGYYDNIIKLCEADKTKVNTFALWKKKNSKLVDFLSVFERAGLGIPSVDRPEFKWLLLYSLPENYSFDRGTNNMCLQYDLSWDRKGGYKIVL